MTDKQIALLIIAMKLVLLGYALNVFRHYANYLKRRA